MRYFSKPYKGYITLFSTLLTIGLAFLALRWDTTAEQQALIERIAAFQKARPQRKPYTELISKKDQFNCHAKAALKPSSDEAICPLQKRGTFTDLWQKQIHQADKAVFQKANKNIDEQELFAQEKDGARPISPRSSFSPEQQKSIAFSEEILKLGRSAQGPTRPLMSTEFLPFQALPQHAPWLIREAIAQKKTTKALQTCLDVLALTRDLRLTGSITPALISTLLIKEVFAPCIQALTKTTPINRQQFLNKIILLQKNTSSFQWIISSEIHSLELALYGDLFDENHFQELPLWAQKKVQNSSQHQSESIRNSLFRRFSWKSFAADYSVGLFHSLKPSSTEKIVLGNFYANLAMLNFKSFKAEEQERKSRLTIMHAVLKASLGIKDTAHHLDARTRLPLKISHNSQKDTVKVETTKILSSNTNSTTPIFTDIISAQLPFEPL